MPKRRARSSPPPQGIPLNLPILIGFFNLETERIFEQYITRGFIAKRNITIKSFRALRVHKIIEEMGWVSTITNILRFIAKVVHEFYATLNDNVAVLGEKEFGKVYVMGHIYDFSLRPICDYLHIHVLDYTKFEKDYALDSVATELLGFKCG